MNYATTTQQDTLAHIITELTLANRTLAQINNRLTRVETRLCVMADMLDLGDELDLNTNQPRRNP